MGKLIIRSREDREGHVSSDFVCQLYVGRRGQFIDSDEQSRNTQDKVHISYTETV